VIRLIALGLVVLAIAAALRPEAPSRASFSGEDERIVFESWRHGTADLFLMRPDGSEQVRVTDDPAFDTLPAWTCDGGAIIFSSDRADGNRDLWKATFPAGWLNFSPGDQPAFTRLTDDPATDDFAGTSCGTDDIVFTSDRGGRDSELLLRVDATGEEIQLTDNTGFDGYPALSPDGSMIAFARGPAGDQQVYVMDRDGTNVRQLTMGSTNNTQPSWSPDGSRIAFTTVREGQPEIFLMNPDGSEQTRLTVDIAQDTFPTFSPDGSSVVYVRVLVDSEIFSIFVDGGDPVGLSNNPSFERGPSWAKISAEPEPYLTPTMTPTATPTPSTTPVLRGDANGDGHIDSRDAALILQYNAGLLAFIRYPEEWDVSGDGAVDSRDAALILQFVAGLIESLPA
jgi:Tol biopolymer transport system component